MANEVESRDIDLLVAAREAWEILKAEMDGHPKEKDVYLCLTCDQRARAFVEAVKALADRLADTR